MNKHYGLDFGTTNSAIAIADGHEGKVLPVDIKASDPRVVRTLMYMLRREIEIADTVSPERLRLNVFREGEVTYLGDQQSLIGQEAVERYIEENNNRHPGIVRTFYTGRFIDTGGANQELGKADLVAEYYEEIDYGTGRLIQAIKTALKARYYKGTRVFGKFYTLEELISVYVADLKQRADQQTGQKISVLKCGRPVHFSDDPIKDRAAQDRLESGLKLAGFEQIEFEFEPVAAAKQFIASQGIEAKTILVFDFGGGTLDTAIVRAGEDKSEVLAADGVYIGGDLLNADIMKAKLWPYFGSEEVYGDTSSPIPPHLYESLQAWYSIPNLNNPDIMNLFERLHYKNSDWVALERLLHLIKANLGFGLYEAIENAKIALSFGDQATIKFADGPIDINVDITRDEFEQIIQPRVEEIEKVLYRTLETAGVKPGEIDVVVRTGGSSLIPVFENLLAKIFGRDKIKQFDTFTSIAGGLAVD